MVQNMFEYEIDKVADMLVNKMRLYNCSAEIVWCEYIPSSIREEFTLDEVLNYIEDMSIFCIIEERMKNNTGITYTIEDLKKINDKRLNRV